MRGTKLHWLGSLCAVLVAACSLSTEPVDDPIAAIAGAPDGWTGGPGASMTVGLTSTVVHGGQGALYFANLGAFTGADGAAVITQMIRAERYRGKRMRLTAFVKPRHLTAARYAGLWMRVDGPGTTLAFDNMQARPVVGSGDWQEVSVVLDVRPEAIGIAFGALFNGSGNLIIDDIRLEEVTNAVASTDMYASPVTSALDSAAIAASYAQSGDELMNGDFEGFGAYRSATASWLSAHSSVLATLDPSASLADLAPFGAAVGNARVVGLGEGTHGTSEFFRLKHRMIRHLVEEKGFTQVLAEVTAPEAEDLNRFVVDGVGDPVVLLSRLHFWTFRAQEHLDLILWMRAYNQAVSPAQRVEFHGIDAQYPGNAIDSVEAFVGRVDPARREQVAGLYACLGPFRNRGTQLGADRSIYPLRPEATRVACKQALKDAHDLLVANGPAYAAASSARELADVIHSARIVQQFEAMSNVSSFGAGSLSRDSAMAENARFHLDRAGPAAKAVVWAHNLHVNARSSWLGGHLRNAFGDGYVALGFLFGRGTLNAVNTDVGVIQSWVASRIPYQSVEYIFERTGADLLLFDARRIAVGDAAAAPLAQPLPMREVGSVFSTAGELSYYYPTSLPADFDLLVYVANASASRLLPYTP